MECIIHVSKTEQHTDQNTVMKATGKITGQTIINILFSSSYMK